MADSESGGRCGIGSLGGGKGGVEDRVFIDCVSSEDIVRLNESEVEVLVVGDLRSWLGRIKSSHRRSVKPVLNGSLPLDLREREKDRPGDLRV
jgi:hypothetical protein